MLIGKVFRVKYDDKDNSTWTKRFKVFTKALKFAQSNCDKNRTAIIDEVMIYSKTPERVNTKWIVTNKTHFII